MEHSALEVSKLLISECWEYIGRHLFQVFFGSVFCDDQNSTYTDLHGTAVLLFLKEMLCKCDYTGKES